MTPPDDTSPGHVLACLPHAGAGASFFWNWKPWLPAGTQLWAARLPGREDRFDAIPHLDLRPAADEIADELTGLGSAAPIVILGHSSGALLAYAVTRALIRRSAPPRCLVVIGCAPPDRPRDAGRHLLDDEALVADLVGRIGYDHPALHHPELRAVILPALRADLTAFERYVPDQPLTVGVPILAVRGDADEVAPQTALDRWGKLTPAFATRTVPGGHMAPVEQPAELLRLVTEHLAELGDQS